jgi:hypothetical protein
MRALFWLLFVRSAWDQSATVVSGTTGEGHVLASVALVDVGKPATVVAVKKVDWAPLTYVPSVELGSTRHYGGRHDCGGRISVLCSLGRRGSASHFGGEHER